MKREADGDMGSPNKRSRRGDDELRLLIPSKVAGSIIGKGGQNITKLRSQYKASITVPDCPGPERMLTLSSDLDTICNIVTDVIPNLEENGSSGGANELEMRMMIHQSQAGCIIGKAGQKIKEMRDKLGARIKIYSKCAPQSADRVIQIIGEAGKCIDTIREIINMTKQNPYKGVVNYYDPHNYDDVYASEYGGYGGGDGGGRGRNGPSGGGGGRGGGSGGGGGGRMGDRDRFGGSRSGSGPRGGGGMGYGDRPLGGGGGGGNRNSFNGSGSGRGSFGGGGMNGNGGNHYDPPPRQNWGSPSGGLNGGGSGGNNGAFSGFGPPPLGDDLQMSGGSGGGGSGDDRNSTQVTIPKQLAGAIIGTGGSRIRKIRQESRASITIDEPLPGSNDRIITISGSSSQIQMAQYLLQQSVHNNSGDRSF